MHCFLRFADDYISQNLKLFLKMNFKWMTAKVKKIIIIWHRLIPDVVTMYLCISNIVVFRLYGIFQQMLLSARWKVWWLFQSENLTVKCIYCKVWSLCYPQFSCVKTTVLTDCPHLCFITTGCQQQNVQNSLQILILFFESCLPRAAEERHKLNVGAGRNGLQDNIQGTSECNTRF